MCKQAFILMDEAMMNDYVAGDAQGLKELEDGQAKGIIFKASNWKDLASSIGADAEILSETLESYNGCCEAGDDSDFGKASEFMRPLAMEGTVYAVEIKSSLGKTMGSSKTDRNFNVVDEQAEPIAGLYAVGVEGAMIWANVYTMNISGIVRRPQYLLGVARPFCTRWRRGCNRARQGTPPLDRRSAERLFLRAQAAGIVTDSVHVGDGRVVHVENLRFGVHS